MAPLQINLDGPQAVNGPPQVEILRFREAKTDFKCNCMRFNTINSNVPLILVTVRYGTAPLIFLYIH